MIAAIHRYVRFYRADDYLRLGWIPLPTLADTPHGQWAVHMAWLCGCDPVEPAAMREARCDGPTIPANPEARNIGLPFGREGA